MLNPKSLTLLFPFSIFLACGTYDAEVSHESPGFVNSTDNTQLEDTGFYLEGSYDNLSDENNDPSFDPDRPFGKSVITTEDFEDFGVCFADAVNEQSTFFNSGTPCIDGMVALIGGRGCEDVIYRDNDDGTHSVYCPTEPTCDQVHTDGYLAVPNNLDWNDFGHRSQMMCQDNNVTVLAFSNKSEVLY
jgi:hypothetical protein